MPRREYSSKDSIENRRARGEIACAECRRHKLKCDRNIPCSTCIRKGCTSICPNGTLPPSNGGGSEVDALKARITEMYKRIRQLEDALQIAHGYMSNSPHPLLEPELLEIKNRGLPPAVPSKEAASVDSDLIESFGTLAVTNNGSESYVGIPDPLMDEHWKHCREEFELALGSAPISYLSKSFPFTPLFLPAQEILAHIEERLPSYARASALAEAYLENVSWFFRPVDREQIMEELIPAIYKRKRPRFGNGSSGSSQTSASNSDPHALALLLIVFAVGAAADLTLPPWNDEADLYYHLSRTAIALKPVFDGSGLHAVQAISLMGAYDIFSCKKNQLEGSWKMLSFALSLAASIGLHRDPAHFQLPPKLIQRRRRIFWELLYLDMWKSIGTGRPVTFTPEVVECELPEDDDAKLTGDSLGMPSSIMHIRHLYVKEILMEVASKLGSSKSVKYSEFLALDQKIRDYDPQGIFSLAARDASLPHVDSGPDDVGSAIKKAQIGIMKDTTLLLMHRPFFARALVEDPVHPIRTKFGPSFLSTYCSATSLVNISRHQFEHTGHYLMRIWPVWAHALTASVTLGSIAACGSTAALSPQAYIQFNLAYEMFMRVQTHPLVKTGMTIMARLHEQAQRALLKDANGMPLQSCPLNTVESHSRNDSEKESSVTSNSGKEIRRSSGGEFGPALTQLRNFLTDPMQVSVAASTMVQTPSLFTKEIARGEDSNTCGANQTQDKKRSRDAQVDDVFGQSTERRSMDAGQPPMLASTPSVDMISESLTTLTHSTPHSSYGSQESPATDRHEAREINSSEASVDMLVDQPPQPAASSSTQLVVGVNDQFAETGQFAYPGSPDSADLFNTFTTFYDMPGGATGSSSGSTSNYLTTQDPLYFLSDPRSLFTDPSLSQLSAGSFPNSDFDVSFNMRASLGQESVLPLLPEDMEAWRTLAQDSRFFGISDELPQSRMNTPTSKY